MYHLPTHCVIDQDISPLFYYERNMIHHNDIIACATSHNVSFPTLGFAGNPIMLLFPPVRLLHILLPWLHLYPLFPLHPFRSMSQNNPDFTLENATSATSRKRSM